MKHGIFCAATATFDKENNYVARELKIRAPTPRMVTPRAPPSGCDCHFLCAPRARTHTSFHVSWFRLPYLACQAQSSELDLALGSDLLDKVRRKRRARMYRDVNLTRMFEHSLPLIAFGSRHNSPRNLKNFHRTPSSSPQSEKVALEK